MSAGLRSSETDGLLLDYILADDDGQRGDFIFLEEEPTLWGSQVFDIVGGVLKTHRQFHTVAAADCIRGALIEEIDRDERGSPIDLERLGAYLETEARFPAEARQWLLDVAWALRAAGFRTRLCSRADALTPARAGWERGLSRTRRSTAERKARGTSAKPPARWPQVFAFAAALLICFAPMTGSAL